MVIVENFPELPTGAEQYNELINEKKIFFKSVVKHISPSNPNFDLGFNKPLMTFSL
jgi:hypothetical protein